jgi:hypothetical protein
MTARIEALQPLSYLAAGGARPPASGAIRGTGPALLLAGACLWLLARFRPLLAMLALVLDGLGTS